MTAKLTVSLASGSVGSKECEAKAVPVGRASRTRDLDCRWDCMSAFLLMLSIWRDTAELSMMPLLRALRVGA